MYMCRITLVPDKVIGVDIICFPVNLIINCSAEWDVRMLNI